MNIRSTIFKRDIYLSITKNMIEYISNKKISETDNVTNIKTERLYRLAEDEFFYFNKPKKAIKLLKEALIYTPCHTKSMKLIGDIFFATGKMNEAFDYYSQTAALRPNDCAVLSALASVCEVLANYQTALDFVNLALNNMNFENIKIYSSVCDLKISLLIRLQRYSDAKVFFENLKKKLSQDEFGKITISNYELLNKKLQLKEKIENLNIKVV